jgi:Cd2+/Zn2+-exporting ATPase
VPLVGGSGQRKRWRSFGEVKRVGMDRIIILTGDNRNVSMKVATECGIDDAVPDLIPADKAKQVRDLRNQGLTIAMVGDGINDAPALAEADVVIAMGVSSTEATIETAVIVLLSDDLSSLPQTFKIGKETMSVIKQNIAFALAVNIIGNSFVKPGIDFTFGSIDYSRK